MPSPPERAATLLLHVFPGFATGGAQVRFCAIANHFGRRFRHAVVAMNGDLSCRERLSPDLDVTFPAVVVRKGDLAGNLRRFRAALRALRPDGLVTSNFGAIEWALAASLPGMALPVRHVHMEDGFGPEERDRQLPRRVWLRRLALRRATVLLPSQTLMRIATGIWRLPPRRLRYVPNGVDLSRFAPAEAVAPDAAGDGAAVVGTVAALRAEKNLGRLLRAFAAAGDGGRARLVIVGDGPARAGLEAEAAALGLGDAVVFAGHRADTASAYRDFALFALSSDTEQMPLSVLEAMAAGLPIAATDVGDVAAMVAAENRDFVVAQDDALLAEALRALLTDAGLRARLGAANRARAEAVYDQQTMFLAHAALWDGTA